MKNLPKTVINFFTRSNTSLTLADAQMDDFPLVLVNPAFCRMTGYEEDEITGKNCRFLRGPHTDPVASQDVRDALEGGRNTEVLLRNRRKDGTDFWNLLAMYAIYDRKQTLRYFLGAQFHVTNREFLMMAHPEELDNVNVVRMMDNTERLQVRTSRVLAESAVMVVRQSFML